MVSCATLRHVYLASALIVYGQWAMGSLLASWRDSICKTRVRCVFRDVFIPLVNLGVFKVLV